MSIGYQLKENDSIQADIARFLESGGQVQIIPFGVSGDPELALSAKLAKHAAVTPAKPRRTPKPPPSPKKIELPGVADLYASGMTMTEIAKHFGVNIGTVRCRLLEAGVKIISARNSKVPFEVRYKDLPADWEQTPCVATLANKYGVKVETMRQVLLKVGIRREKSHTRLTDEQVAEIGSLWRRRIELRRERQDLTDINISKRLGTKRHYVADISTGRRPAKAVTPEMRSAILLELRRRYQLDRDLAQLTDEAIAHDMGCSSSLVDKVIQERRWQG